MSEEYNYRQLCDQIEKLKEIQYNHQYAVRKRKEIGLNFLSYIIEIDDKESFSKLFNQNIESYDQTCQVKEIQNREVVVNCNWMFVGNFYLKLNCVFLNDKDNDIRIKMDLRLPEIEFKGDPADFKYKEKDDVQSDNDLLWDTILQIVSYDEFEINVHNYFVVEKNEIDLIDLEQNII